MKILHFMPAYRGMVQMEAAYSMMRDMFWAMRNAHEFVPVYRNSMWVQRTRNWALKGAIENGYDLLLMQDADVFADGCTALQRLHSTMHEWSGAVVGASYMHRGGQKMNANPARPGEVYEGEVGTGLMLIDVKALAKVPGPWFELTLNEAGTDVACGEDIHFCRHVKAHGLRVLVDATIPTGHIGEVPLTYPGRA